MFSFYLRFSTKHVFATCFLDSDLSFVTLLCVNPFFCGTFSSCAKAETKNKWIFFLHNGRFQIVGALLYLSETFNKFGGWWLVIGGW